MHNDSIRLDGKKILVTGVSRPLGIGATLARRLAEAGARVAVHGFSDYDITVGHKSAIQNGTEILAKQLGGLGLHVTALTTGDLMAPGVAEKAVDEAAAKLDGLDGLVLNHAYSTYGEIDDWTPEHIDPHLLINVRASMIMIQSFVSQADTARDNAITLFTSGQYLSPMVNEIAYCVSKEAVICLCRQTSRLLGDKNIRVNCINPGPNDTGYCFGEAYEAVARMFPSGRWGTPEDTADLLLFLHSPYAKWITGQVIASDGGVRENW
ncbi:MAG: SDR family oxidoreductase [Defluviitaleaceae bacterium]|nr:SDR family oxidoreductase [Defluviitaleaceae bacterium]